MNYVKRLEWGTPDIDGPITAYCEVCGDGLNAEYRGGKMYVQSCVDCRREEYKLGQFHLDEELDLAGN